MFVGQPSRSTFVVAALVAIATILQAVPARALSADLPLRRADRRVAKDRGRNRVEAAR
jgi:hypothetical protein